MSLLFTNYDRHSMCTHENVLGPKAKDGSRMCVRCGTTVRPEAENFTEPTGSQASRRTRQHAPR